MGVRSGAGACVRGVCVRGVCVAFGTGGGGLGSKFRGFFGCFAEHQMSGGRGPVEGGAGICLAWVKIEGRRRVALAELEERT